MVEDNEDLYEREFGVLVGEALGRCTLAVEVEDEEEERMRGTELKVSPWMPLDTGGRR